MALNLPQVPFKLTPEDMGVPDYIGALTKGFDAYKSGAQAIYEPRNLASELAHKDLVNKYYGPKSEAEIKNLEASAAHSNRLASPEFGDDLSGFAKESYGMEQLRNRFGEDSPVYQQAKKAFDARTNASEALSPYRNMLTNNASTRAASPLGKMQIERADVDAGFMPGTNRQVQLDDATRNELRNQYDLDIQKKVTDTQARQRALSSANIDKTIKSINPSSLTQYSGIGGAIQFHADKAKALSNPKSAPARYVEYKKAETNAQLLAHQVRQFYGDSIQPAMLESLGKMTNPSTWDQSPQVALELYKSFINILKTEGETYRSALKSKDVYQGIDNQGNPSNGPYEKPNASNARTYNLETGAFE